MDMHWIFEIEDYRQLLREMIKRTENTYGYKSTLARAAGCQPAYISQVLAGTVNLTPEHASGLIDYWQLSPAHGEYFLTLVHLGRAGSESLRKKLKTQAAALAKAILDEEKEITAQVENHQETAFRYYSQWRVSAVHVLLSISSMQEADSLASHLGIEKKEILAILRELEALGLATHKMGRWAQTVKNLHAAESRAVSQTHHRNWRLRSIEAMERTNPENFHYTAVCALSEKDYQAIRNLVRGFIEKSRDIVAPSKEKLGACLIVDWFKLGKT